MDRPFRRFASAWNNCSTIYNANLGSTTVKQKLLRLCRLDVLAVGLALLALAYACCVHHRAQERLNEIESVVNQGIHIPAQPHPPVKLETKSQ